MQSERGAHAVAGSVPALVSGMTRRALHRTVLALAAAPIVIAPIAAAPRALDAQPSDTTRLSHAPLFSARDAWVGLGLVAGTIGLMQLDRPIAEALQDSSLQSHRSLRDGADVIKLVNERSLFVMA